MRKVVNLVLPMATDDDGSKFAGLDERGDDHPVFCSDIVADETSILLVQDDGMGGPFVATGAGLDTAITQKAAKTGDTPEPRQKKYLAKARTRLCTSQSSRPAKIRTVLC